MGDFGFRLDFWVLSWGGWDEGVMDSYKKEGRRIMRELGGRDDIGVG
jgi:hypothetical protein